MAIETITVKAPGVVKFFGEFSTLYGRTALAAAIDLYASAAVSAGTPDKLSITLSDLGKTAELDGKMLDGLFSSYKEQKYPKNPGIEESILPYATIASRLFCEQKLDVLGKSVTISSEIPMQRGCASSGACSAAFAIALIRVCNASPDDALAIDIIRDGERVCHKSPNAGGIDASTSYFGGLVTFSKGVANAETAKSEPHLLIIDTGPKKSTAEMVGMVAKLYEQDKAGVESIMDGIQECSTQGLQALKANDLRKVGEIMFRNHELLKKLGVSTKGLDDAVAIAKENGAYGAKLSGGGGGGIAIVLGEDFGSLTEAAKRHGMDTIKAGVSKFGAKHTGR